MIELTVLGAGPAYTSRPGAVGASYLLRSGGDAIVLDLGQGAFTNLAGAIEPSSLRAVVVSHLHPDHFVDLVPLRHYLLWDFDPPRRVAVLGPAGLAERIDALHDEVGFAAASLDIAALGGPGVRTWGRSPWRRAWSATPTRATASGSRPATGPAWSIPATAATPTTCARSSIRATPCCPRRRSGRSRWRRARSTSTRPMSAGSLPRPGSGRVLLTHLLMGHDRDATAAAARELAGVDVSLVDPGDRFSI